MGITIDDQLSWEPHIVNKINQAKKALYAARSSLGKMWGPSPKMMLWLFKVVIRPMITYGSMIWAHGLKGKLKNKLRSLQRLALLMTGHYRNGTPTAGLEVITDTMPIDLFIDKEAVSTVISE